MDNKKIIWIAAGAIILIIAVAVYFSSNKTTIISPNNLFPKIGGDAKPPGGGAGNGTLPGVNPDGKGTGTTVKDEDKAYYTDLEAKECTGKETKLDEAFFIEFTAQNLYLAPFAAKLAVGQNNMAEWAVKIKAVKAGVPTFCINDKKAEDYTNSIIESTRYEELMPKIEARIKELEQKFGKIVTQ
ncbi:MAG: hypothetical protein WC449_00805 [Candidatus Paceibacterota bacterium]